MVLQRPSPAHSVGARHRAAALVVAIGLATTPVTGRARTASAPEGEATQADDASAKFDRAEALYREGRYEEAIEALEELIVDFPEPVLYYNLARAQESAGRLEDAIATYERYLDAAPDAADASAIRARIERLRERTAPPPTQPTEAPSRPPPRRIVAPWVLTGVGGVGLVLGAVFGGLSRARSNEARAEPSQRAAANALIDARRFATAANVAFAVGGALAIAGVSWGIAAVVQRRRTRAARVTATLHGVEF